MHLNKEIPYNVRQKTQLLGVDAKTGVLVCEQDLIVSTRSHQVHVKKHSHAAKCGLAYYVHA
jgi:hypothetical protein